MIHGKKCENEYLVRDINSPINFHQSMNIFLTKGPGAKNAIRENPGYFYQILNFES